MNTWPDGAMTPFRNEKNSNWEGAFRVPELIRWPGKIPAGSSPTIIPHLDWLPTFLAAAGEPDIAAKLKAGHQAGARPSRSTSMVQSAAVHDRGGANSPRNEFFYFSDDGDLVAMRYDNWKLVFLEQRAPGTCAFGLSRSFPCGCRRSSTCARIPSSAPTSPRTPTTTG